MEIATAEHYQRVTACFARKLRLFEVLSSEIEDAVTLKSLNARWRAIEEYHDKGWIPDGWLEELRHVRNDHEAILKEQE